MHYHDNQNKIPVSNSVAVLDLSEQFEKLAQQSMVGDPQQADHFRRLDSAKLAYNVDINPAIEWVYSDCWHSVPEQDTYKVQLQVLDQNNISFLVSPVAGKQPQPNDPKLSEKIHTITASLNKHIKPLIEKLIYPQESWAGFVINDWIPEFSIPYMYYQDGVDQKPLENAVAVLELSEQFEKLAQQVIQSDSFLKSLEAAKLANNITDNPALIKVIEFMAEKGIPAGAGFNMSLAIAPGNAVKMDIRPANKIVEVAMRKYIEPLIKRCMPVKEDLAGFVINNWIENLHWEE